MNAANQEKEKEEYKRTRLLMWEIRTKYVKKGRKIKPEQIIDLGDAKKEVKLFTVQDKKRFMKAFGSPGKN